MKNNTFVTTLPNLIEIQCSSFCWFLTRGIANSFTKLQLSLGSKSSVDFMLWTNQFFFIDSNWHFNTIKRYQKTLIINLYVPMTFFSFNFKKHLIGFTNELICLGEIPLLTNNGTFIINGYEKIVIQQLRRSPGMYFSYDLINYTKKIFRLTIIPQEGKWICLELNSSKNLTICINKGETFNFLTFFNLFFYTTKSLSFQFLHLFFNQSKKSVNFKQFTFFRKNIQNQIFNKLAYNLGSVGFYKFSNSYSFLKILKIQTVFTIQNLFNIINYFLYLTANYSFCDDIDNLKNKYISTVGDILTVQFISGLKKLTRQFSRVSLLSTFSNKFNLSMLFSSTNIISIFRTFFTSSRLVQFLDQTNLLAELSHRRRILMSGNLSAQTVSSKIRDIHSSFFNRICPIETAEGSNIGLSTALALYARLNKYGFIETPFFVVKNGFVLFKNPAIYLTLFEEEFYKIASFDICVNSKGKILKHFIQVNFKNSSFICLSSEIQLISISSLQGFSVGTSLIPFLEHNDANRTLMGTNMQRQASPLLYSEKAIIGTGLEFQLGSSLGLKSYSNGLVLSVLHNCILILDCDNRLVRYFLLKFKKLNHESCSTYSSIVWKGENISCGQVIADSLVTYNGELALGQNILIAYMSWNGYNFEDSILINESLIYLDIFTSLTITSFTINLPFLQTDFEILTSKLPNIASSLTQNLDVNGVVKKGIFIKPFDLLIGKLTRYSKEELSIYRLLTNINSLDFVGYNSSIYATSKSYGTVLDIVYFSPEVNLNFSRLTCFKIIIYFAHLKKIQVGDKLSGRHGNKGIISKILSAEDMPYLPNGKSIELILNPLGVPSRMNIGQLFEGILGFAVSNLSMSLQVLPFDEMFGDNSSRVLISNYLQKAKKYTQFFWFYNKNTPGKIILRDGKTGHTFDNPILICKSYIFKLIHLSEDKINARGTGPYSLITQQPVKGKSLKGGQRFGEMEVWSLEAFGASYTLQEMLTLKSDDILGRNKIIEAIIKHKSFKHLSLTESFKILLYDLKALGLEISFYKHTKNFLSFKTICLK